MENTIVSLIKTFFASVDKRNWKIIQELMKNNILIDYSSMNKNPAAELTPSEVISSWASFLPGFDSTHHHISNFEEKQNDKEVSVHFSGKAEHFIQQDVWVVEGAYDVKLILENQKWLISELKFNFEKQYGNLELPSLALERMRLSK